jgi:3-hydroxyisobutyrate dehydrogenase-like beta-hydroxyacid dehydrogenase
MASGLDQERETSEIDTIGLIGAGRVGQWLVTKLTRAGYETVVSDVDPEAAADAVDKGATAVESPADATRRSDVVVLALPTREDVEVVMEGRSGVLSSLKTGQVVIDTGTTPPEMDVHYQNLCDERDASYVDCGLTRHGPGGSAESEEPAYTMFVGGKLTDYEGVRPVIDALSYEHEFFEGIGNGHVAKAGVALRATCRAAIAAEVCEFHSHNGLDPGRIIDLLDWDIPAVYADPPRSSTRGFERAVETDEGETEDRRVRYERRGSRPRLRTSAWAKDSASTLAVARSSNSYVPMLTAAYQTQLLSENYGAALMDRDLGFGDPEWHVSHLRSVYRALSRPQKEWRRLSRWSDDPE